MADLAGWDEAGQGILPGTTGANWTAEEQTQLDQLLSSYNADGSRRSHMELVLLVASRLPGKTARDVALRIKWLDLQQQQQDAVRKRKQGTAGDLEARVPPLPAAGKKSQPRAAAKKEQQGLALRPANSLPLAASSMHGSSGNLAALGRGNSALTGCIPPAPLTNGGAGGAGINPHPSSPVQPSAGTSLPFMYPSSSSGNAGANSDSDGHMQAGAAALGTLDQVNTEPPPALPPLIHIPPPGSINPKDATSLVSTLLEHCKAVLGNIKHNMSHCKVVENMDLLARYRDHLLAMMHHMNAMPGVMQQMPALPVQPNFELAARVLPPMRMPSLMGPGMLPIMGPMMPPVPPPGMVPPAGPYPFPTPPFPHSAPMAPGPFPFPYPTPPFAHPPMQTAAAQALGSDPASGQLPSDSVLPAQGPAHPPPFGFPHTTASPFSAAMGPGMLPPMGPVHMGFPGMMPGPHMGPAMMGPHTGPAITAQHAGATAAT